MNRVERIETPEAAEAVKRYTASRREEDFTGKVIETEMSVAESEDGKPSLLADASSIFHTPPRADNDHSKETLQSEATGKDAAASSGETIEERDGTAVAAGHGFAVVGKSEEDGPTPPPSVNPVPVVVPVVEVSRYKLNGVAVNYLPHEELTKKDVPEGVDLDKKEDALSDEDFTRLFRTSREEFSSQPKWKRDKLKKELKLF
jgi:Villin headpiece domain